MPISLRGYTELLNMSLLVCAAMVPGILGAFERRACTPLILSLSMIRGACVSAPPGSSIATGGAILFKGNR